MADPAMPPRLVRWLLRLPGGDAAVGWLASRHLTRPPRKRADLGPDAYGWDWHPLRLRSSDGIALAGWCLEPPDPVGTVALFHGLKNCRGQTLGRSALLASAGFRCVAIDHRGHGDSGGRDSSFGWHERHDVTAVSDHIRDTWPGEFRAAVGVSMGAAAVCFAAADGTNWHAVVLESVYDEVLATFRRRVTVGYHPAWFGGLIERAGWVTEWRLGVKFARMRPAEYVRELDGTPVLFVSGEDDPTVPPDRAREIARQHAGPGSLWLVPGAGHRDVFEKAGADYGRRVVDFLVSVRGGLSKAGRSAA